MNLRFAYVRYTNFSESKIPNLASNFLYFLFRPDLPYLGRVLITFSVFRNMYGSIGGAIFFKVWFKFQPSNIGLYTNHALKTFSPYHMTLL